MNNWRMKCDILKACDPQSQFQTPLRGPQCTVGHYQDGSKQLIENHIEFYAHNSFTTIPIEYNIQFRMEMNPMK